VARKRIGIREVEGIGPNGELWDTVVSGFGIRRQRSPAVAYILLYRTADGRSRRFTIGRHGSPWTPDAARDEAKRLLGRVADGEDPAALKRSKRASETVSDLCDSYLADVEAGRLLTRRGGTKKPSTIATDRSRIEAHIRPLLGKLKVPSVTREDVERFMHDVAEGSTKARKPVAGKAAVSIVRGGKGAASRTVGLLGGIFSYAVRKHLRADNPVQGVVRHADGRRERRLTNTEYACLGSGLAKVAIPVPRKTKLKQGKAPRGGMWPPAIAATRFLAFTGWRSGEALTLRWRDLDIERRTARLPDTKTGLSVRPLSQAAVDVLRAQARRNADDLVFPPTRGKGTMSGFPSLFSRITRAGQLPADITPHVLRHSFASLAGDLGYSELTIAALVGHQGRSVTSRYVHTADAVLLAAADAVASKVAELMANTEPTGLVIQFKAAG
jgi:site-specific recombinase XerD